MAWGMDVRSGIVAAILELSFNSGAVGLHRGFSKRVR
jgi:hypothetical protein